MGLAEYLQGVTIQIYLAIIASMLLFLAIGRKPAKRELELIHLYSIDGATFKELTKGLTPQKKSLKIVLEFFFLITSRGFACPETLYKKNFTHKRGCHRMPSQKFLGDSTYSTNRAEHYWAKDYFWPPISRKGLSPNLIIARLFL